MITDRKKQNQKRVKRMKTIQKIALFAMLTITSMAFAEKKDRVRLNNEYGSDVIATVYWQHKNKSGSFFDKKTSVILPAKISMGLKAPVSGYRAFKIEVVPASNQVLRTLEISAQFAGLGMILTGTGGGASVGIPLILGATLTSLLASTIAAETNKKILKTHKNKFFVIESTRRKSMNLIQEEINVKLYKSEEDFNEEVAKDEERNGIEEMPTVQAEDVIVIEETSGGLVVLSQEQAAEQNALAVEVQAA